MAPEQVIENGIVTSKTDYWSFGITLLWMLSGKNPYSDFNKDTIYQMLISSQVPIPDDIDDRYKYLLKGLLCRDVTFRWGYEEILEWSKGNESIPVCPDQRFICKFDGKEHSPRELASVFISSPENWKKAQTYVQNYLIKCLEKTNNHEIAASIIYNIGNEENICAKVIFSGCIIK